MQKTLQQKKLHASIDSIIMPTQPLFGFIKEKHIKLGIHLETQHKINKNS